MSRLRGLRVWVTRPAHQADSLCTAIEQAGGHAFRQPLLAIEAPSDPVAARSGLAAAEDADDAIFTSTNAVAGAWRLQPDFAPPRRLAAIGRATAVALETASRRAVTKPEQGYTSEDLLALPDFAEPAGRRVAVITGENGRGHIQSELAERDAVVDEVAVYRRSRVPLERPRLRALLEESDAIIITSGEALSHLAAITPNELLPTLHAQQLVVPSARVLKLAASLGFKLAPLQPDRLEEPDLVDKLARLTQARTSGFF